MNYTLIPTLEQVSASCIILGTFAKTSLSQFSELLPDPEHKRLIPQLSKKCNEPGEWAWQSEANGSSLMVIDCGDKETFDSNLFAKIMQEVVATLLSHRITKATFAFPLVSKRTADWQLTNMVLQINAICYQLMDFKTKKRKVNTLESVEFYLPNASQATLDNAICIAKGVHLTQHLAELPGNHCTPSILAHEAQKLAEEIKTIQTKVIAKPALVEMKMGALLAVGQGSAEPPCLIELSYQGGKSDEAPVVLIGKGITFDAGGISLKPAAAMEEMKYDMAGAASVLGTLKACALLKLPINVKGIIATAENMPSGTALKPGDIITSYSGQTIEVINTDAEGRLVLADALAYAEQFKPKFVIDIATLTGAIVVALGYINTGLMTNDEELAKLIIQSAYESDDKTWRLPLDLAYAEAMESTIADMVNAAPDRAAGSITAASFLAKFAEKFRWAHLDIAGTAWVSGKNRHATGRPVPLLVQVLRHVAATH